jgi:hypothetical protein
MDPEREAERQQERRAAREAPGQPPPIDGEGLIYRQRTFVEIVEAGGSLFYEGEYRSTTYNQSRLGIVELNGTIADMIRAQVEIGRKAAELHGESGPKADVGA